MSFQQDLICTSWIDLSSAPSTFVGFMGTFGGAFEGLCGNFCEYSPSFQLSPINQTNISNHMHTSSPTVSCQQSVIHDSYTKTSHHMACCSKSSLAYSHPLSLLTLCLVDVEVRWLGTCYYYSVPLLSTCLWSWPWLYDCEIWYVLRLIMLACVSARTKFKPEHDIPSNVLNPNNNLSLARAENTCLPSCLLYVACFPLSTLGAPSVFLLLWISTSIYKFMPT